MGAKKLSLLCFLFMHAIGFSQHVQLKEPIRFLALGDSYTIGQSVESIRSWPNQLYSRLSSAGYATESLKIIAQTGWRTDVLASAIAKQNLSSDFNLVSLLIGVNDQFQGKPFSTYETAFEDLLRTAIALAGGNKDHVFVVSIPDYAYTPFGGKSKTTSDAIDAYNAVNKSIAKEYDITYFNITPISRDGIAEPKLVASDNLHPSALMYERWVDLMMKHITVNNKMNSTPSKFTEKSPSKSNPQR